MTNDQNSPCRLVPEREDAFRAAIVAAARGWIGTPYQHQASLKGVGADCLGLLRGVWREIIGPEPEPFRPYSPGWAEIDGDDRLEQAARLYLVERPLAEPFRAGQVILFRWRPQLPAKHCALLTGPSHFVHAHDGAAVAEVALVPGWRRRIAATFDFPKKVT